MNNLLIVDDEATSLEAITKALSSDNYQIFTAQNAQEGIEILNKHSVQVIIADQRMPYMSGSQFLRQVKNLFPGTVRILLSGQADSDLLQQIINDDVAYKFIIKPWNEKILRQHVQEAFQFYSLKNRGWQAEKILASSLEGLMITDPVGTILQVNQTFTSITKYSEQEAVGHLLPIYADLHNDKALPEYIRDALSETGQWHGEIWKCRKDGEVYPEWLSITAIYDENHQLKKFVHLFLDITEQKNIAKKLNHITYYDSLTELGNRIYFTEHLETILEFAQQNNSLLAVIWLDLDKFSNMNNKFGQHIGNLILQSVAKRIKKWGNNQYILARLGNDDFAIVLSGFSSMSGLEESAKDLVTFLQKPYTLSDREIYINMSMGISVFPKDSLRYDTLMEKANIALNYCKRKGSNSVQFYNCALEKTADCDFILEAELHDALKEGQFVIHYQPILSLATNEMVGIEALLRWQHPQRGLLYPEHFLSLCASSKLIVPVGEWVIEKAISELKKLHNQDKSDIFMAVNVSGQQLPFLFQQMKELLAKTQIPASAIVLEMTEDALIKNSQDALKILEQLRDLGLRLALDDFGVGYSSLNYLKLFPFAMLKIDKNFIQDINRLPNSEIFLSAIVALGKNVGLTLIAEGVETQEQLKLLREMQCDLAQGYLFCEPLPYQEMLQKMRDQFLNIANFK